MSKEGELPIHIYVSEPTHKTTWLPCETASEGILWAVDNCPLFQLDGAMAFEADVIVTFLRLNILITGGAFYPPW